MPVGFVAIEAKEEDTGSKRVDMGTEKSSEHDMRFSLHDIVAREKELSYPNYKKIHDP